jgi:RND family efflux transporter MFP subunit
MDGPALLPQGRGGRHFCFRTPGAIRGFSTFLKRIVVSDLAVGTMPMSYRYAARLAALPFALLIAACGQGQQSAPAAPPPPTVTVAQPVKRNIVDLDEYVGRFLAIDSVEIRSRVSGYLDRIHFTDGQMVTQGDLLFSIDRRPFKIILDQMQANLAQARANLAFAESDLARGQQLVREKTITEQTYDQRTQTKRVAEATVAAQEALVRAAELDYNEFSTLRAPVTGRIGDRRVSPGNLVTGGTSGNTTLLATIVSIDPIRFEFTFDEASYLRYERLSRTGKDVTGRDGSVLVALRLIDEKDFGRRGRMDFVDNVIDRSSGTIRGRAVFNNPDGVLTPGMFGRIRVPASPAYDALLLPDTAIGTDQTRKFVYVVDGNNTVQQKFITPGQLEGELRVIKTGVEATDRVIVNGLMRARAGIKVTPQEEGAKPPAAPPQAKN